MAVSPWPRSTGARDRLIIPVTIAKKLYDFTCGCHRCTARPTPAGRFPIKGYEIHRYPKALPRRVSYQHCRKQSGGISSLEDCLPLRRPSSDRFSDPHRGDALQRVP